MKNTLFLNQLIRQSKIWVLAVSFIPFLDISSSSTACTKDSLLDLFQTARTAAAAQLIYDNAAIPASYIFEINEKTVNDILLNTLVKGLLPDSVQTNTLGGIARQCPYEGGTAVLRARAILEGLTGQAFDDEVLCAEGQQGLMMPRL